MKTDRFYVHTFAVTYMLLKSIEYNPCKRKFHLLVHFPMIHKVALDRNGSQMTHAC